METSRREFLGRAAGALAGVAFTECAWGHSAAAQAPAASHRRREIVVGGKRVRTVDVHAHCHVPEALALMGLKENTPALVVTDDRLKVMDEQGIDMEALSLNPVFWY